MIRIFKDTLIFLFSGLLLLAALGFGFAVANVLVRLTDPLVAYLRGVMG